MKIYIENRSVAFTVHWSHCTNVGWVSWSSELCGSPVHPPLDLYMFMLHWIHPQCKPCCWIDKDSMMKGRVLQWVRLVGIKKLSGDAATGGKTGKKERGSVSMVHRTGVTVATGTGLPASHAASSSFLPFLFFFYPSVLIPLPLSLSLCPSLYLSCHLSLFLFSVFFSTLCILLSLHTYLPFLATFHPSFPWAHFTAILC